MRTHTCTRIRTPMYWHMFAHICMHALLLHCTPLGIIIAWTQNSHATVWHMDESNKTNETVRPHLRIAMVVQVSSGLIVLPRTRERWWLTVAIQILTAFAPKPESGCRPSSLPVHFGPHQSLQMPTFCTKAATISVSHSCSSSKVFHIWPHHHQVSLSI